MLRTIIALLCMTSVAEAGRIVITGSSGTYFSQRQTFEFRFQTDQAIDIPGGYISLAGAATDSYGRSLENFSIFNDWNSRTDDFSIYHAVPDQRGVRMGEIAIPFSGREFVLEVPLAMTGMVTVPDTYYITAGGAQAEFDSAQGAVGIDNRDHHTPEPSAWLIALAGSPCLRHGFRKRHRGRQ